MKKNPSPKAPPADIPIREIRGQRVLLDSDLAAIYGVPTSRLNEAISATGGASRQTFSFNSRARSSIGSAHRNVRGVIRAATSRNPT